MWPPAALDFLRDLEANNDRDWFKANRARYDADLLGPTRELATQLSDLGEPHFFRPWNNTRFRPGPPLKEHIAMTSATARRCTTCISPSTGCSSAPAFTTREGPARALSGGVDDRAAPQRSSARSDRRATPG